MSRQINFYADEGDAKTIHSFLSTNFGVLFVLKGERGTKEDLVARPFAEASFPATAEKVFLVPQWALPLVEQVDLGDVYPNQLIVDVNASPVLEYSRCMLEEDGALRKGRFYYAYAGEVPVHFKKEMNRLFSFIRKQSVPLPKSSTLRIFQGAARTARFLRPWPIPAEPNPFFGSESGE